MVPQKAASVLRSLVLLMFLYICCVFCAPSLVTYSREELINITSKVLSSVFIALIGVFLRLPPQTCRNWLIPWHHTSVFVRTCVPTETFCTYNNNKPWFSGKLRQLRQAKEEAYRSGDRVLYNRTRNTLFMCLCLCIWQMFLSKATYR